MQVSNESGRIAAIGAAAVEKKIYSAPFPATKVLAEKWQANKRFNKNRDGNGASIIIQQSVE